MSGVLFCSFHDSKLTSGKNNGQHKCRGICNWSCVHDAIDSEEDREDKTAEDREGEDKAPGKEQDPFSYNPVEDYGSDREDKN